MHFGIVDQQFNPARFYVKHNPVAGLHDGERAAHSGFRRDMQYDGAKSSAAHPRIGNAYHIFYSLAGQFHRDRQIARLRHAWRAFRPGIAQNKNVIGIHIKIW